MRSSKFVIASAAVLALVAAVGFYVAAPAQAQIRGGTFEFRQQAGGDTVAWCFRTADGATEAWAYVDGSYRWADETAMSNDPWTLSGVYTGPMNWSSYGEWKDAILGLPETQGRTIKFQLMTVSEETVVND